MSDTPKGEGDEEHGKKEIGRREERALRSIAPSTLENTTVSRLRSSRDSFRRGSCHITTHSAQQQAQRIGERDQG